MTSSSVSCGPSGCSDTVLSDPILQQRFADVSEKEAFAEPYDSYIARQSQLRHEKDLKLRLKEIYRALNKMKYLDQDS